ncbi:hypothetical protein GCM10011344_44330 [Dokdonia pacifica]|nr:hypothetical protein GCM10011344_44330 [Dokdonia pacifica]
MIATYILDLKNSNIYYRSKTEVRFVYTKSLSFNKKADVRYNAKPTPNVAKDIYIKNNRTFFARIPSRSASREET